jgi:hypothetical protein
MEKMNRIYDLRFTIYDLRFKIFKNRKSKFVNLKSIFFFLFGLAAGWMQTEAAEVQFKTLELEMDPRDAEVLFRKEPYDTSTFPVAVVEEERRIPGRVEVMGQFSRTFLKKSILIKFNEGNTWQGNKKIYLRSMSTDLSYMRDWLTWDIISSLGMVSPRITRRSI